MTQSRLPSRLDLAGGYDGRMVEHNPYESPHDPGAGPTVAAKTRPHWIANVPAALAMPFVLLAGWGCYGAYKMALAGAEFHRQTNLMAAEFCLFAAVIIYGLATLAVKLLPFDYAVVGLAFMLFLIVTLLAVLFAH